MGSILLRCESVTYLLPILAALLWLGCDAPDASSAVEAPVEFALDPVAALDPVSMAREPAASFAPPSAQPAWVVDSFGFLYGDEEGAVNGMDIDAQRSLEDEAPLAGTCGHGDFSSADGASGIDHQFLRVTSAFESLLPGGIADQIISNSAKDGSMTLVVTVDDDAVQLIIAEDAPLTGNDGEVLPLSSFRPYSDAAYHADLGPPEWIDGAHVAGPGDVRLRLNIQIVEADLFLTDAYVRVLLAEDGGAHGVIQGYWSTESIVEILASTSAHLLALGYTREEFEAVLAEHADGARDESGTCHALSAAFRFTALPAFLLSEEATP
jgi:hypothetical protein